MSRNALVLAIAAALSLATCTSDSSDPTSSAGSLPPSGESVTTSPDDQSRTPYVGALTYAWPARCAVRVTEIVEKDGQSTELWYWIRTQESERSRKVEFISMTVASVNGEMIDLEDGQAAGSVLGYPSFVVDESGEIVEVGEYPAIEYQIEATGQEVPAGFADRLAQLAAAMMWNSWVRTWNGSTIDANSLEGEGRGFDAMGGGSVVISSEPAASGLASLRVDVSSADPNLMGELLGQALDPSFATLGVDDFNLRVALSAVVMPRTLQPMDVLYEAQAEWSDGGSPQSRRQSRRWVFDWEGSDCPQ